MNESGLYAFFVVEILGYFRTGFHKINIVFTYIYYHCYAAVKLFERQWLENHNPLSGGVNTECNQHDLQTVFGRRRYCERLISYGSYFCSRRRG